MGTTKTEIFNPEQNQMAAMLKALAHPARIAILQRIILSKTCIRGDLVGELSLAIKGSIEGTSICLEISGTPIHAINNHI